MTSVPAWKLQLQQNIAKKKSEKLKQDEQRRIQMLPPWKRAAIEQQTQPKNVIIITNSSSTSKTTSSVSNSPSKTVVTNSRTANSVNTVNSNDKPKNVSIVSTAKQKSPTHTTNSSKSSGTYGNRTALKQTGKSQSIDLVDNGKQVNNNIVSSKSFDDDDDGDLGVSDEHCISVHNNPFLRREKKGGVTKSNVGGQAGLGGRQKVQDSTSPTAGNSTSPRVAWNNKSPNKSPTNSVNTDNNKSSVVSSKENVTKNNIVIEKQKPPPSPTRKVVFKQPEIVTDSGRQSRSTERKLSVHEIMKQFGRAASHEEKERIKRQNSADESDMPSPRSQSSKRDYRNRERSPSPVKNRYRSAQNLKPRPKSTPVEVPSSVILSKGRSPTTSPQPVRRSFHGTSQEKTRSPKPSGTDKKVVINSKSSSPKYQAPKAVPQVSVSDKPANVSAMNGSAGSGAVIIAKKKHLEYDTNDAGRTPPMRRKVPLPASAIIDLNTKGPIQEASGKPPVDPEQIAKEKAASIPKNENKHSSSVQNKSSSMNGDVEKPKPNTVSSLLGAFGFGQKKSKAPPAPVSTPTLAKQDTSADAIPYPEDFRRPKSWQEKEKENKNTLPAQVELKQTKPANSENESRNSNISRPTVEELQPVEISPIPRPSSHTISPIPKSETITNRETISPIPNREIISSDSPNTKNVTVNGHIDKTVDPEDSPSKGKGEASQEMMAKARALKKVKKKVNYEVIGGNAPTRKPSMQASKSGRNRNKTKVKVTFSNDNEEFEYQSEQSLLAELGEGEEEDEEPEEDRHSSVSEDEEVAPAPSGFRENVPKGTGGLQSYTPSYLRDLTPSAMREYQEATRRKDEPQKEPEPEPLPYETEDAFSSAGSSSAAMLF